MSLSGLARFEWILIDALVLGLLFWQLVSVRRAIRVDRQKTEAARRQERTE